MAWERIGRLFNVTEKSNWMYAYASLPIYFPLNDDTYRIYFSTRNKEGKSYPAFAEFENRSNKMLKISEEPLLPLGESGTFDDCGIMGSSIVRYGGNVYYYYIGWNTGLDVPYRLSIGLAISHDEGLTFDKYSVGPILDRSVEDPILVTAPCVIKENDLWRMWYVSSSKWIQGKVKKEPVYAVKYAESSDGVIWKRKAKEFCLDIPGMAIGRPWVIKDRDTYKMWFSGRGTQDYRTNKENSYRIMGAESVDCTNWSLLDYSYGVDVTESGWDSEMTCYCSVSFINDTLVMFYNGNAFGKTGVGVAVWE